MNKDKKLPDDFDTYFGLTTELDITWLFGMLRNTLEAEDLYKEIKKFPELSSKFISNKKNKQ